MLEYSKAGDGTINNVPQCAIVTSTEEIIIDEHCQAMCPA